MTVDLSIIVPVYNEEKTIERVLRKLVSMDYGVKFEIIVVNDGSTDRTGQILGELRLKNMTVVNNEKNMGKGYSIRRGVEMAKGKFIIIQDADLEYDPQDIRKLITKAEEGFDVVYGSRFLGKISNMSKIYEIGNIILTKVTNLLFGANLTDVETCYKLIRRDVFLSLNLLSNRFDIEVEITGKLLKRGYKIVEIPISYKARTRGEGKKIRVKDGIESLIKLFRIRLFD